MAPASMPPALQALALKLSGLDGVVAVALGGSRAAGTCRPDSDWDLGVYYRASRTLVQPAAVRALGHPGHVSELGEWGPIVNGGAWLTVAGRPVDVLYRNLDTIEDWAADAQRGSFEILDQNGYLVGAPTYLPVGELASCRVLTGELPRPVYPEALAEAAPSRWRGRASVALMFADGYARTADPVCCSGMLVHAALCTAHARLSERREWVLNEKRLVERAGLAELHALLATPGDSCERLAETVARVSADLDVAPLTAR